MSMIRQVDSAGEVIPDEKIEDSSKIIQPRKEGLISPLFPELEIKAVQDVMGLEDEADKGRYRDNVHTLLDWAKTQTTDHTPSNLQWIIRSLELKLGTPPLAEKRIIFMSRYAYLMMEKGKLDKEVKQFEQPNI